MLQNPPGTKNNGPASGRPSRHRPTGGAPNACPTAQVPAWRPRPLSAGHGPSSGIPRVPGLSGRHIACPRKPFLMTPPVRRPSREVISARPGGREGKPLPPDELEPEPAPKPSETETKIWAAERSLSHRWATGHDLQIRDKYPKASRPCQGGENATAGSLRAGSGRCRNSRGFPHLEYSSRFLEPIRPIQEARSTLPVRHRFGEGAFRARLQP